MTGHTNDHVIEIGIEVLSLRDINTIGGLVVIASEDVVDVVDSSWSKPNLREIGWPHSSVGILSLINRVVGGIYPVVDDSVSILPLLVVVLLEVVMGWVDTKHRHHIGQLYLSVGLVQQSVILLVEHAMTVPTVPSEYLEPSPD